jgi:hypothetical protein
MTAVPYPIVLPFPPPAVLRTIAVEVPGHGRVVIEVPSDPGDEPRAWFTPASVRPFLA